jgi:hypothetical protein
MRLRIPERLIPLACALTAAASAALAVIVSLDRQDWSISALVRMDSALPLSKLALASDPGFRLRTGSGFYDGAYFYAIARDPLATGQAHRLLHQAPYYWGHPGYGWLTWLASVGGHPSAVPAALLAVGILSIALAGAAASVLAGLLGWTRWGGLVVALNPGLVFAVANDTSEALAAAVLLAGLVAYARGRRGWALVLFGYLCLVKEPLALVPLAIGAWELWRRYRPSFVAAALAPALAWWLYLRIHLGAFPFGQGSERLTAPFAGWEQALVGAASQSWSGGVESPDTAQLGQAAVPLIVAVGLGILVASVYSLRLRNFVQPAFLALAAVYACITANGVQYPKDLLRELALVLTLLPFALAVRTDRRARPPSP